MKNPKLISAIFLFLCLLGVKSYSQGMMPPQPVENKTFDAMIGDWTGDLVSMGMPMNANLSVRWALNHQFITVQVDAVGKDNADIKYSGMGIYGFDDKGNIKNWWYDVWGLSGITTGTGSAMDNKIELTETGAGYKGSRSINSSGAELTIVASGSMTFNGQDSKYTENGTFRRK